MDQKGTQHALTSEARLAAYLDAITGELGHASRAASAQAYCTGLLLPGERKSIEPMAARLDPGHVQAQHQSLHHVVAQAEWDDAALLAAVRAEVLPAIERHGPVRYWIVDDSGFPKQGTHSVGVARQYCQLGKPDNCQVAVSLSVANDHASLPIAYQLFLPEVWADDPARRAKAGVPETIRFETKTVIALGQLRQALAAGVPVGILLGDAAYGDETGFRVGVTDLGLRYVLGVRPGTSVWAPGTEPRPAPDPAAARCGASTGDAQGAGVEPACPHLAHGHLARGSPGQAVLALRRRAGAPRPSRHPALRTLAGGMVADRVARGGCGTGQILVL
jgi:SRSO17 transposase